MGRSCISLRQSVRVADRREQPWNYGLVQNNGEDGVGGGIGASMDGVARVAFYVFSIHSALRVVKDSEEVARASISPRSNAISISGPP
jgi:hypothetical protein